MANFNNNKNEEMSMEDILSSIRKYVSEEDAKQNVKNKIYVSESESDNSALLENESIIKLDETHVSESSHISYNVPPNLNSEDHYSENIYEETSDLSEEIITPAKIKKSGPFDKLTDALKSYGKPKIVNEPSSSNSVTMEQFLSSIAAELIKKWVDENMAKITEEVVMREIEKLKSE